MMQGRNRHQSVLLHFHALASTRVPTLAVSRCSRRLAEIKGEGENALDIVSHSIYVRYHRQSSQKSPFDYIFKTLGHHINGQMTP